MPLRPSHLILAIATAAGCGAPALAQTTNATVVIGESPARACYDRAAASDFTAVAVEDCTRAFDVAELMPYDRAATYTNRAIIHQGRGDLRAAERDFKAALEIEPTLQAAHLNLGGLYVEQDRWADAKAALDQGVGLDPALVRAEDYFARAVANEELGLIPEAYEDYRTASERAPEWALPREELARFQIATSAEDNGS